MRVSIFFMSQFSMNRFVQFLQFFQGQKLSEQILTKNCISSEFVKNKQMLNKLNILVY